MAAFAELTSLSKSGMRALELMELVTGKKQVVRQAYHNLSPIQAFCERNGLAIAVSPLKTRFLDSGFSNKGVLVTPRDTDDSDGDVSFVYLSRDELLANKVLLAELRQDDATLGRLLGYPPCCVDFFDRHKKERKQLDNNYEVPVLAASGDGPYPWQTNIFRREKDMCLLSHFPCTLSCEKSVRMARERFTMLANDDPGAAKEMKKALSAPLARHGRRLEFS